MRTLPIVLTPDLVNLFWSKVAIGLSPVWPPRPCRRCGVIVTAGRQRYCLECRSIVTREDHTRRQRARRAAARDAGLTPSQRAKVKREREAS